MSYEGEAGRGCRELCDVTGKRRLVATETIVASKLKRTLQTLGLVAVGERRHSTRVVEELTVNREVVLLGWPGNFGAADTHLKVGRLVATSSEAVTSMNQTRNMRREITAVVSFLKRIVAKKNKLGSNQIELFAEKLAVALQEKFKGHWYPENPSKGQAYRCIRVNRFHREDPELLRACKESGVQYGDLGLPLELTLWVDPGEVCCRYGENNPCFSVASYSCGDNEDVVRMVTGGAERAAADFHPLEGTDGAAICGRPPSEDFGCF